MCGIAGFIEARAQNDAAPARLNDMLDRIAHRGPDDTGAWIDGPLAIGHRRLAILDLSPLGKQPMVSASGRYVIALNGEVYNHAALRRELELGGHVFRGRSDTEVLLALIEATSLERALRRCIGMFAIVLWDKSNCVLQIACDRMGEKPLYYGWQGDTFLFGSELKALKVHPSFAGRIDRDALTLLMRYGYVPAPHSIYQDIRKVIPGTVIDIVGTAPRRLPDPVPYWSIGEVAAAGTEDPFRGDDGEAIDELETRMADAISLQRVADVPLGAFLSGGTDSSTVVALMQAQADRPVKTFTIGFEDRSFNEAEYAKAVARHLGTDHTELYVTPRQAMEVIPSLPDLFDEPLGDASQIPTFLVARLARQHVTVSLSGDGGDEIFGGYRRYCDDPALWRRTRRIPGILRRGAARGIRMFSPDTLNSILNPVSSLLRAANEAPSPGEGLHALAEILTFRTFLDFYRFRLSQWRSPTALVLHGSEPGGMDPVPSLEGGHLEDVMMLADAMRFLPGDILAKVDRCSMAVGLEARAPLLDHRVVEFAWRLPLRLRIRNGVGKWLLRQVLYKYVPKKLIDRPKMGFGIPLHAWLRGPLREWAEDLLSESRLRRDGIFDPNPVRERWRQHLSGQRSWEYSLWTLLTFQAWFERQVRESHV